MRKRLSSESGQVTVFICLLTSIFVSVVLISLEMVYYYQSLARGERSVLTAAEHIMADYQADLSKRYHLYFLDETYNGSGREVLLTRAIEHLEYTLSQELTSGLYSMEVTDASVNTDETILDHYGEPFRKEIDEWVLAGGMLGKSSKRIPRLPDEVDNSGDRTNRVVEDPRDGISQIMKMGILSFVTDYSSKISKDKIDQTHLPSSAKIDQTDFKESVLQKANSILYVMEYFNCATSVVSEEETHLKFELEYLAAGKASDYDNLESVANEIAMIRTPINMGYLLTDEIKKGEALGMATALVGITGQPAVIKVAQYAILTAWGYAESLMDVKILLQGEKVPLIKNKENWNLSLAQLTNLFGASFKEPSQETNKNGLSYEDYLRILLTLPGRNKNKYMRALDLMQMNLQLDNPDFYIRNCIYKYTIEADVAFERKFAVLPYSYQNNVRRTVAY